DRFQARELFRRGVAADVGVLLDALVRDDEVGIKAFVVGPRGVAVAGEGERVLVFAREAPRLRRALGMLPHRQPGTGLDDAGELGPEMARPQPEPRRQLLAERAAAMALEQDRAVLVGIDDRCVADGVRAAGDPGFDLAYGDFVADRDAGLD